MHVTVRTFQNVLSRCSTLFIYVSNTIGWGLLNVEGVRGEIGNVVSSRGRVGVEPFRALAMFSTPTNHGGCL